MVRLTQNSFMGGQLDFEMLGRQDYSRYAKGATKLVNFNILRRGGIAKRQGFDSVIDLCNTDGISGISANTPIRIVPFAWKKERGFVLVFIPGHIYAVCTADATEGTACKVYDVAGSEGVYGEDDIFELDYQQCGDVMFIAHQNHMPSKITRGLDADADHGFVLERCNFSAGRTGSPTITTATVTRAPVECKGGTVTEEYVATAVFDDGGETIPSLSYSGAYAGRNTGADGTGEWTGTSYYLPWTESQKISVSVTPSTRTMPNGVVEFPKSVRLYKKAFNYYGMIGEERVGITTSAVSCTTEINAMVPIQSPEQGLTTDLYAGDYGATPAYGIGRQGYSLSTETYHMVGLSGIANGALVEIMLGKAGYVFVRQDGNGSITGASMFYQASNATGIRVKGVHTGVFPLTPGESRLEFVDNDGLSDDAFVSEFTNQIWPAFLGRIRDAERIVVPVTNAGLGMIRIRARGGEAVVNAIHVINRSITGAVTFVDNNIVPDASKTPPELMRGGAFTDKANFPGSVCLTQQRLVWASTKSEPARVLLSQVGDFYTYDPHQIQKPDDAIDFTLPITRFPKINHIVEMRKLLMFNSACEWMVDSSSSVSGITYETIQAYPQSYCGSKARLKPIVCNNTVVFCERTGQSVRRFAWDLANDGFAGRDISILSSSIFDRNPIVDWTYQQFPFSTVWCALADGTAASLEYMEEQEIIAWATHRHGGGRFLCFATTHGISPFLDKVGDETAEEASDQEEVYAVVQRGYSDQNGEWHATGLWLERMRPRSSPEDTVYHSICMDSVRILRGNQNGNWPSDWDPVLGEWMDSRVNDGLAYVDDLTEDGRVLTKYEALELCNAGKKVYEGFPYTAEFMSVFPSVSASTVGAGQFDIKDIGNVGLRLMASHGGTVRAEGCLETEPIRYEDDPGALKNAVFGGGMAKFFDLDAANVKPVGINTRDGRMHVEQALPWPFAVIMYEVDLELEVSSGRRS